MSKSVRESKRLSAAEEVRNHQLLHYVIAEVEVATDRLPAVCRPHLGNGLFNLALGYLLEQHGSNGTATILARAMDAVASQHLPSCPEQALDPFKLDG